MSAPAVCCECLTVAAVVDEAGEAGVCPACRHRLLVQGAFDRGWRAGWAAAETFYRIDRATGEAVR